MGNSALGPASVFIVIAAFALIFFLILANALEFKDDLFALIFPKEQSFAQNQSSSEFFKNIKVEEVASNSVKISWQSDIASTSKMMVGITKDVLPLSSVHDTNLSLDHEMYMAGLVPQTKYYFKVVVRDAKGVEYFSELGQFETSKDD
jgi:hypothetical protein